MKAILVLLIVLSGCQHKQKKLEKKVASWVGQTEDLVINVYGKPPATHDNKDGSKTLFYGSTEEGFAASFNNFGGGASSFKNDCIVSFKMNPKNTHVEQAFWRGHLGKCMNYIVEAPWGPARGL